MSSVRRLVVALGSGVGFWVLATFAGAMLDPARAEPWITSLMWSLLVSTLVAPALLTAYHHDLREPGRREARGRSRRARRRGRRTGTKTLRTGPRCAKASTRSGLRRRKGVDDDAIKNQNNLQDHGGAFPGSSLVHFLSLCGHCRIRRLFRPLSRLPGPVPNMAWDAAEAGGRSDRSLPSESPFSPMSGSDNALVLLDLHYWQAWWKIHVEALTADRLLEDAVRRGQYKWAAAIKRAKERSVRRTELSRN